MKLNIRSLSALGLLLAVMLIFTFTPLGYFNIGLANITLMCLPVIIGTLALGLTPGLILGFLFGLTSLYTALTRPDALFALVIAQSGIWPLLPVIFIPRLLIPVFTHLVGKALGNTASPVRFGLASLTGSLTNTVFYLGLTYLFWAPQIAVAFEMTTAQVFPMILGLVLTNGLPEAAAAVVICTPVLIALGKANKSMFAVKKKAA